MGGIRSKVGIFWYNATRKELFGVVTHKRTDYLKPKNAGGGLITRSGGFAARPLVACYRRDARIRPQ